MPMPRLSQSPRLSENTTGTSESAMVIWSVRFHDFARAWLIAQIANGVSIAKLEPHAFV
jgi:hypothetical protein